jgi:hypothetical protein
VVFNGNKSLTDADLGQLLNFDNEQRRKIRFVVLSHTNITAECIKGLAVLPNLIGLFLRGACIADDAPFELLPKTVEIVNLDDSRAADLTVSKLSQLPQLSAAELVKVSSLRDV